MIAVVWSGCFIPSRLPISSHIMAKLIIDNLFGGRQDELLSWLDITDLIENCAQELNVGELAKPPLYRLEEAMSAMEVRHKTGLDTPSF